MNVTHASDRDLVTPDGLIWRSSTSPLGIVHLAFTPCSTDRSPPPLSPAAAVADLSRIISEIPLPRLIMAEARLIAIGLVAAACLTASRCISMTWRIGW
jgi:hypothetical protein